MRVSVDFRNEKRDVVVDYDGGYEADVNVRVIDWHFDGLSPDEHDALAMTDDEDQLLYEQIAEQLDNLANEF